MPPYKVPKSGRLPKKGKHILKKVYVSCRTQNPGESHKSKSKCAKIAWSAVRKAGYKRKSYAKGRS